MEIGGGGLGVIENVLVVEEFCKADSGLGMALHLAFLPAKLVKLFGTREQQRKCLSPLVNCKHILSPHLWNPRVQGKGQIVQKIYRLEGADHSSA